MRRSVKTPNFRQVGIKLPLCGYAKLDRLAASAKVTPTTYVRHMIQRHLGVADFNSSANPARRPEPGRASNELKACLTFLAEVQRMRMRFDQLLDAVGQGTVGSTHADLHLLDRLGELEELISRLLAALSGESG